LLKTNLHVMFLPDVIVCCCILYNMIFDGRDLDINSLMMQLELDNRLVNVHPTGHKEVREDGNVIELGVKKQSRIRFGNVKNKSTHNSGTISWKQVISCALKFFEKQLCNVAWNGNWIFVNCSLTCDLLIMSHLIYHYILVSWICL